MANNGPGKENRLSLVVDHPIAAEEFRGTREPLLSAEVQVSKLDVVDEELYLLSFPLPQIRYPQNVTSAEVEVIDLLFDGKSTSQISVIRGTSKNTVSKQLLSIYEKAVVKSRTELVAWMLGNQGVSVD